jgi:thioredoxin-like negative regulator of GroEL
MRRKAEANPENIQFQLELARFRFQSGQKEKAGEAVKSVAGRSDEESTLAVGDFYASVGEADIALGFYRQALDKSPRIKRAAQKRIAAVHISRKQFAEALSLITAVRKEDRDDDDAVRAEADIRAQTGVAADTEAAVRIYREILEKSPGDSTVRFNLAQILLARGDASGRRELEKCVGTTPNHNTLHLRTFLWYSVLGR